MDPGRNIAALGQRRTKAAKEKDVTNEVRMEAVLAPENLTSAWKAVKSNKGSAGIDGKSIAATASHLKEHWPSVRAKLEAGTYVPAAVKGKGIAKRSGGERLLGIPTVQDRLIQHALGQVLMKKFDPMFSVHSHAYRPGRSTHDAVKAAQSYVWSGKTWVVDIDLSAFFDNVNHDILFERLKPHIADKRVLALIGRFLRAPMALDGKRVQRGTGTPQGGPLSPILANIYLDGLDRELESRGLSFCRYADDIVVFVSSERSAQRVLERLTAWIERHLRLPVNHSKSGIGRPWERQMLGFRLLEDGRISIAPKSLEAFKDKVRHQWDACQSLTSKQLAKQWRDYVQGWSNYFRLADVRWDIPRIEKWVRRHIRKCFWQRWHDHKGRLNAFKRLGAHPAHLRLASCSRGAWRMARHAVMNTLLSNKVLRRYGLWMPSDLWAT